MKRESLNSIRRSKKRLSSAALRAQVYRLSKWKMLKSPKPLPAQRCKSSWNGVPLNKSDRNSDFVTDACATVAVAYHRAAGVYIMDKEMQELGTAAVHLLTIATSWTRITNEGPS